MSRLAFPAVHQAPIRMTNGMDGLSQRLKRRAPAVRVFPNREAHLRLMTALLVYTPG